MSEKTPSLEQRAETLEALNRDCVYGCEKCRRQRVQAILEFAEAVRREALEEAAAALVEDVWRDAARAALRAEGTRTR